MEDSVKNIESDYCGVFQISFYENLFEPSKGSQILDHENLTKNTIPALLNEFF